METGGARQGFRGGGLMRLGYARNSAMSRVVRDINREMQAEVGAGAGWAVRVAGRIAAGLVKTHRGAGRRDGQRSALDITQVGAGAGAGSCLGKMGRRVRGAS